MIIDFTAALLENKEETVFIAPPKLMYYKKGRLIYQPQEEAATIYLINEGCIKIEQRSKDKHVTKAILTKGAIFGELAMLGESHRRNYAYVMGDASVYVYTKEMMQLLLQSSPVLQELLLQKMRAKLLNIEDRFTSILFKKSSTRVIEFLLKIAKEKGKRIGFDILVKDFLIHREIANYTATSRQTVNTVLNYLRSKHIISYRRNRLMIRDIDLLAAESETTISNIRIDMVTK